MGSGASRAYPPVFSIARSIGQKGQVKTKRRYINGTNPTKFWVEKMLPELHQSSLLDLLRISEIEAQAMFYTFVGVDADNSGGVELHEFHNFLEIPITKFSERIFSMFDVDGGGSLVFQELLVGVWNYCTYDHKLICKFIWNIFDVDKKGVLQMVELDAMMRMIHGTRNADPNILRLLTVNGDEADEAQITFTEFLHTSMKHSKVLLPAMKLQEIFRRKLGGEAFWEHQTKVRMRELENQSDNFPVSVYNQQDDLAICDSVEMALRKKLEGGNYNNDELRGSCDG